MESQQSNRKPKGYYVDYSKLRNRNGNRSCSGNSRFRGTPDILNGNKGFLLTTIDEVKSYLEMRNIFEGYFEELYETKAEQSTVSSQKELMAEDELEHEMKKLRMRKPFKQVKTHCRNSVFINIVKDFEDVDPNRIVDIFFDDLIEKRQLRTSNTFKVLPIIDTFPNNIISAKESLTNILNTMFKDEVSKKYFIEFQIRGNYKLNSEDKQKIIEGVADTVSELKPEWSVDRENADYIITLVALRHVCCIAILKDYFKRAKYNVNELCKDFVTNDEETTIGENCADSNDHVQDTSNQNF